MPRKKRTKYRTKQMVIELDTTIYDELTSAQQDKIEEEIEDYYKAITETFEPIMQEYFANVLLDMQYSGDVSEFIKSVKMKK